VSREKEREKGGEKSPKDERNRKIERCGGPLFSWLSLPASQMWRVAASSFLAGQSPVLPLGKGTMDLQKSFPPLALTTDFATSRIHMFRKIFSWSKTRVYLLSGKIRCQ